MSRRFSISYFPEPKIDPKTGKYLGDIFKPKVPIWISCKSKATLPFHALVDSGSDRNLFPAQLGEKIGINIKDGIKIPILGIGGIKIKAYTHKANLHIEKCTFDTEVDFSYEQQIPLLGRRGFFDLFKRIDFNEKTRMVGFKLF